MIEQLSDLHQPIVDVLSQTTGVASDRIIPADEGRGPPQPETSLYATYALIPVRAYGQPRKLREPTPAEEPGPSDDWEDWEETVVSSMQMLVSVNFYNEGSQQAAGRVHNAPYRKSVRELLFNNGIAWRYASEVRRMPMIVQAGVEQRYQLDLHWFVETAVTETTLRAAGYSVKLTEDPSMVVIETQGEP